MTEVVGYGELRTGGTKDYTINWLRWLGTADTLSASSWVVSGTVLGTPRAQSFTGTTALIWLACTVPGEYFVHNTVETAGGRTEIKSLAILVEDFG